MAQTYEIGTKAWQPDPTEGWVASEVEQKTVDGDNVTLVFVLANGEVRRPYAQSAYILIEDRREQSKPLSKLCRPTAITLPSHLL